MQVAVAKDDRPGAGGFLETVSDAIWYRLLKIRAEQREYRLSIDYGRKFADSVPAPPRFWKWGESGGWWGCS